MREQNRISVPLRFCCAIASADPEVLAKCNQRRQAQNCPACNGAALHIHAWQRVLWSAVFSQMLPIKAAVPGGLFVGLIIYLLDLAIATSDWDLKGVLRERTTFSLRSLRSIIARMVKFGSRLVLALTLAMVTGTYVTLFWFNDTIENFIHQNDWRSMPHRSRGTGAERRNFKRNWLNPFSGIWPWRLICARIIKGCLAIRKPYLLGPKRQ